MKIKRESPSFAVWDALGMAAHLEEMEAKGWQFRGADWLGRWEYQENLPQQVRYAVTYAPSRRNWKLAPTEAEQDLEDLCFDAGWRKVAALSKFHIYRNPDPDATPLETDEVSRLDTMDRSLRSAIRNQALIFPLWSVFMLGLLIWAMRDNLPRTLAMPSLPAIIAFCLWLAVSELIPWILYRNWMKDARSAADAGLPCPVVRGWKLYRWFSRMGIVLLLFWLLTGGSLALMLIYAAIILAFYGLRWYLENRMEDSSRTENIFQISLIVVFVLLFGVNRFYREATAPSLTTDTMPMVAQDLVDTSEMDLYSYELNGSEGPLAAYHEYWQPDNNSAFSLNYTLFDLHCSFPEKVCRNWFRGHFEEITGNWEQYPVSGDPEPWGAEALWRTNGPDLYGWLIFYEDRIVFLTTVWELTPEQITIAAEKLAP